MTLKPERPKKNLNPEREREIRQCLHSFKHWHSVSENPDDYYGSHGPDMEALLSEIDRLREEVEQHLTYEAVRVLVIKDQKQRLAVADLELGNAYRMCNELMEPDAYQRFRDSQEKIRGGNDS